MKMECANLLVYLISLLVDSEKLESYWYVVYESKLMFLMLGLRGLQSFVVMVFVMHDWRFMLRQLSANREGRGCLFLRCLEPNCNDVIGEDLVEFLMSGACKKRYREFLFRSSVENNKRIRWCPAPDCECAIEYRFRSESYDGTCDCSFRFCWNCVEESHSPVSCEIVKKWMSKNSSGLDSRTWLRANSQQCPKFGLAIQKTQGCMHMICKAPRRNEFCWTCLGPWRPHDTKACNRYAEILEQRGREERGLGRR